ncbi:hypothetical protein AgCh_005720 [Apium graveolens]
MSSVCSAKSAAVFTGRRESKLLEGFKLAVEDYGLNEVELIGGKYTWEKGKVISDHEPIKLNLFNTSITRKQFRFKFENTWLKEVDFVSDVSKFWQDFPPIYLLPKLISVSSYMAKWGRVFFHKFREKVVKQKKALDNLKDREDNDGIQAYFSEKAKLEELLLQEETYWK